MLTPPSVRNRNCVRPETVFFRRDYIIHGGIIKNQADIGCFCKSTPRQACMFFIDIQDKIL